ncbi:MAG TPA: hypothetical protein VMU97_00360 [Candidatus Dormibacteraeota bacterium]|nr:hypothetical protein [Candidatus Dormibacteraeota bacterium]
MSETRPQNYPDLSHLVGELPSGVPDYAPLVEWAKDQDIPPYGGAFRDMVGSKEITIGGEKATVGWVSNTVGAFITKPFVVENPGGERITVVEGEVTANIIKSNDQGTAERSQEVTARAEPGKPAELAFDGGDTVILRNPAGPDGGKCWYVCFYPEA